MTCMEWSRDKKETAKGVIKMLQSKHREGSR